MNELAKLTNQELTTMNPTDDQIIEAMVIAVAKYNVFAQLVMKEDKKLQEFAKMVKEVL